MASSRSGTTMLETLLILLSVVGLCLSQTSTNCDPTKKSCPADVALGTNATFNFTDNTAATKIWNIASGPVNYVDSGAQFVIQESDAAPTLVSNFYIFFGRVSTVMQAASGKGIVSSIVLLSDDLDEIDWEIIGSNSSSVQSNFYGKGNHTTYDRVQYHELDQAPQTNFHNYTTVWTAQSIEWWIDNKLVRTLNYNDPLTLGGKNFPQTPCQIKLGNWVGGKMNKTTSKAQQQEQQGMIKWAGGLADFSDGPSYTMTVQSLYVQDFSTGKEYIYGDHTGDWQSIKVVNGTSSIKSYLEKPHGFKGHWQALPKAAQIAIVCAAIGIGAVLFLILVFCCIKQRRAGRREKAVFDAEYEKGAAELMEFRTRARPNGVKKMNSTGSYAGGAGAERGVQKMPSVTVMEAGKPMKSGWL